MPRGEDRTVINGIALTRTGRSHTLALWEASQAAKTAGRKTFVIVDIDSDTQIVAMAANNKSTFNEEDATRGAHMLFLEGAELSDILQQGSLLQAVVCKDGIARLVTKTSGVRDTFERHCYVVVSRTSMFYKNCAHGPICTCKVVCRNARCEHVKFVQHVDLRLQPADWETCEIPATTRGRPKGKARTIQRDRTKKERGSTVSAKTKAKRRRVQPPKPRQGSSRTDPKDVN